MKLNSQQIFNISAVLVILLLIVLIVLPFNINNLDQAQRIAQWKLDYEKIQYCFSLVNYGENSIVPNDVDLSENDFIERIKPYFNFSDPMEYKNRFYKYRKMNGRFVRKSSQFYFSKFYSLKDGTIFSVRKNNVESTGERRPHFFVYLDINGKSKPNRIGQDIFFIEVFTNSIDALGHGQPYSELKSSCSPIGAGQYCGEYYVLGGKF